MTKYREALADPNVQAFLRVIRQGETSQSPDAYRTQVGGKLLAQLGDHPREVIKVRLGGKVIPSTAAGAYQFLGRTWDECAAALDLPDFSADSQDLAAVFLIDRRRALADVLAGRIEQAIAKCNREWASLPGSPYGQPVRTMAQALETYRTHGGVLRPAAHAAPIETREVAAPAPVDAHLDTPTAKDSPMPLAPILGAVLPSIVAAIPALGQLFGSGSQVAERNVKAAEMAVGIVQQAVGAKNAQEAAEIVAADPAMASVAAEAVQEHWWQLAEAGGGGIDGARKADVARIEATEQVRDVFKSHSFWVTLALLPLVYLFVLSLVGVLGNATWSDDVRAGLAGSIVSAIIGGLVGYYFGQTTSRNRGPAGTGG